MAPTGSDARSCATVQNPATPKLTMASALACVGLAGTNDGAGDTVEVAAGSYAESLVDAIASGSGAGAPFLLKCTTNGACTMALASLSASNQIFFSTPSQWVIVQGFTFTGGNGVRLSAFAANPHHDISFIDCEMSSMPNGTGIDASGSDRITVTRTLIHDVGSVCTGLGPGFCHGIYVAANSHDWVIEDSEVYNSAGYGIHVYDTANTQSGMVIRRNRTHDNDRSGILTYWDDHLIYNNISYGNAEEGILLRGSTGVQVLNNTLYQNGLRGAWCESGAAGAQNNIAFLNGVGSIVGFSADHNLTTNPAFTNAGAADFTLLPSSAAIDAGLDLSAIFTDDFDGVTRSTPWEIGAYSFGAVVPPSGVSRSYFFIT